MNVVPTYTGAALDSIGRTFDQAPSAPAGSSVVTVGPVGERHLVMPVAEGMHLSDLVAPLDGLSGQRVEEDLTKIAAEHLRPSTGALVGLIEEHGAVLVEHPRGLTPLADDGVELVGQPGGGERDLTVVLVDVELAPLGAGGRIRLGFVDGGVDAVDMEDPGEGETAEARTDDRDRCRHCGSFQADGGTSFH